MFLLLSGGVPLTIRPSVLQIGISCFVCRLEMAGSIQQAVEGEDLLALEYPKARRKTRSKRLFS